MNNTFVFFLKFLYLKCFVILQRNIKDMPFLFYFNKYKAIKRPWITNERENDHIICIIKWLFSQLINSMKTQS